MSWCWTKSWGASLVSQTAHSPGRICGPGYSSSSLSSPWDTGLDLIFSFPFLPNSVSVDASYNLGCRRLFLPVSSLFSMRIALHVEVFLMCLQGTVEIHIHVFSHLDLSVFNIFRLHLYTGSYTDLFMLIVLWKYHLFSQLFSKAGYSAQYSPLNTLLSNVLFLPFYKKQTSQPWEPNGNYIYVL